MYKANKENLKQIKKIPQYFSEFDLFLYSFFFIFGSHVHSFLLISNFAKLDFHC